VDPEPVWTTWRKLLTLPGLELRPLGRPARSQLLYQLCLSLTAGNVSGCFNSRCPDLHNSLTYTASAEVHTQYSLREILALPKPLIILLRNDRGYRCCGAGVGRLQHFTLHTHVTLLFLYKVLHFPCF
jgi:hypothetical protein